MSRDVVAIRGRRSATGRPALRITRFGAIVAAACAVGTLSACGGSGTAGDASKAPALPAKVDSIAATVPDSIAKKGTLVVAAGVYPPAVIEPVGGGTPTGWDIENARQIAAVLGLKVQVKIIPFDGVITGLAANRYDAAVGEIYITPERTKSVTFVTNHQSTDALLVPAQSKIKAAGAMDDLCGLTLAAQLGSAEAALVEKIADKCAANGQAKVTPKTFQAQANVNLALSEGRVDAGISSASQVANVLRQTKGKFRLVELPWAPDYDTGMALARNKDTDGLAKAVAAATDHLIKNGKLQNILDEFNDGQGAIDSAKIVPPLAE